MLHTVCAFCVQEQYMQQVYELVPDYGCEKYNCTVDDHQNLIHAITIVDPYHAEHSGLRMVFQGKNMVR